MNDYAGATWLLFLSGDLYHFRGERTLDTYPNFEVSLDETRASRASVEEFHRDYGCRTLDPT